MNICSICNSINPEVKKCKPCSMIQDDVFLCPNCSGLKPRLDHIYKKVKKSLNDFDIQL